MVDVLAALLPPGVMAGVVIAFVVWVFRQRSKKDAEDHLQNPSHPDEDRTKH